MPDEPDEQPPTPEAEPDDQPLRWYVIAAYVVLVAGGFALTAWLTVAWYSGCDEGRRVQPFTAGDSLRGALCESTAASFSVPASWLLGLVLATVALVRWGGGRLRLLVCSVLLVSAVGLPPAVYAGLKRSGTECTGAKLAAYRTWVDDGSKGSAPYECRTF